MNLGLFFIGVVLLLLGLFAAGYTIENDRSYFGGLVIQEGASRPYVYYGWPLIIAGIVVMIAGLAAPFTRTTRTYVEEHPSDVTRRRTKTIVEEEE